jgi:hypothetical protein
VCGELFELGLPLAKHMVQKERPSAIRPAGEHIEWLESFLGKPFSEFGWKSDKKIAIALKSYYEKHGKWPE